MQIQIIISLGNFHFIDMPSTSKWYQFFSSLRMLSNLSYNYLCILTCYRSVSVCAYTYHYCPPHSFSKFLLIRLMHSINTVIFLIHLCTSLLVSWIMHTGVINFCKIIFYWRKISSNLFSKSYILNPGISYAQMRHPINIYWMSIWSSDPLFL